ncbi:hypothetical protein FRC17_004960 [Serendipita sp. 399]|nr:hypothetical protein FRC17_004960 [Serendipita sp. 399]
MPTKNASKVPVKRRKYVSTVIGNPDMTVEDIPPTDNVVLIMGPTGSGKSTFINYICGGDGEGIGHHLESFTDKITITRVQFTKEPKPAPTRNADIHNGRTDRLNAPVPTRNDERSQTPNIEPLDSTVVGQSNTSAEHRTGTPATGGQYDRVGRSLGVPTAGAASVSSVEINKHHVVEQYDSSSVQRSGLSTVPLNDTYSNQPKGLTSGKLGSPTGYLPETTDLNASNDFDGTTLSVQQSSGAAIEDDQSSTFGHDPAKTSEGDLSAFAKVMSKWTPFGRRSSSPQKLRSKVPPTDHLNVPAAGTKSSISTQSNAPIPNRPHNPDGYERKEPALTSYKPPEATFQGSPSTYYDTIQPTSTESRRTDPEYADWTKANSGMATRGAGKGTTATREPAYSTPDVKRSNTTISTQSKTLVDGIHDDQPYPFTTTDGSGTSNFSRYNGGEPRNTQPGSRQPDPDTNPTVPYHSVPYNPYQSEASRIEKPPSSSTYKVGNSDQPVASRPGTNPSHIQPSPYPVPVEKPHAVTVAQASFPTSSQRPSQPVGRFNNDSIGKTYNSAPIERSSTPNAVLTRPPVVSQKPSLPTAQANSDTVGKSYDQDANQSNDSDYVSDNDANDDEESDNDDAIETTCFIDTPGFDDTYKSDIEILTMIAEFLVIAHGRKLKLDTILYLHRISDNRMAGSPLKNLQLFASLCGNVAMPNVTLVTTMWSLVPRDVGEERLGELRKDFWSPMLEKGCTVEQFDDTFDSAFRITFPDEERLKAILLSKQLVQKRKKLKATEVGYTMNAQLKKLEKDKRDASKRLKNVAKRQKNPAVKEALESELQTLDNTISEVSSRARSFDLSFGSNIMRRFSKQQAPIIPTIGK